MTDDIVCELHGGAIAKADGTWLCCWQEEFAVFPQTPPSREPHPPPADFRDRVAAARERSAGKATEEG